jgi:hypothetical protein
MYCIKEPETGLRLHYFPATDKAPGRYGWGGADLFGGEGTPVQFELREEAEDWMKSNKVMTAGCWIEEDKPIPTTISIAPKKRGRPATGKAMTAAERKRAQRERERQQIWGDFDIMGNWQNLTMTALLEGMASAVRAGSVVLVEMIAAELARRAAANKTEDHIDDFEA